MASITGQIGKVKEAIYSLDEQITIGIYAENIDPEKLVDLSLQKELREKKLKCLRAIRDTYFSDVDIKEIIS